jgi:hypothetical protein
LFGLLFALLALPARPLHANGEPITILFSNLERGYTGADQTVDPATDVLVSPGNNDDYTLTISYPGRRVPPRDAGSYAVRVVAASKADPALTATANATLLIAKAPLVVTADDKARLLGVANPRFTLRYEGFVNGETETAFSRRPVGATTAKASSPAGDYAITINGGVAKNYEITTRNAGALTVIPAFPGAYESLLVNLFAPTTPAGKLTLTLPARGAKFTGRLDLADEGAAIPLSGALTPREDLLGATGFAERRMRNGDTYRVELSVSPAGLTARVFLREAGTAENFPVYDEVQMAPLQTFPRRQPSPAAGAYTLALLRPALTDFNVFEFPGGSGYATATIAPSGLLKLTGLFADGSRLTASLSPDADSTYRLFVRPYGTRPASYAAAAFTLQPRPDDESRFHVPDPASNLVWHKAAKPSGAPDKLFPEGFAVETTLVLDRWLPPAPARRGTATTDPVPAETLAERLGLAADDTLSGFTDIAYGLSGLGDSSEDLPRRLEFTPANKTLPVLVNPTGTPPNPTRWSFSVNARTGLFTARFRLVDEGYRDGDPFTPVTITRNITVRGVLRQPPDTDGVRGAGFFLLPPAPGPFEDTQTVSSNFLLER